ncbi:hypothetical protein LTR10_004511 [Elasticomyces elasticus]|nr:hypothetical protein LTR10_004511 [Elasticomyces elasticus]KAK4976830.1 hypothetical protein LTR42_002875 [Elasticomyces elasticus]
MGRIVALLQGEVFEARRTIAKKDEKTKVLQEKLLKSDARDKALRAELMKKDEEIKVLQAAVMRQPMTRNPVTMEQVLDRCKGPQLIETVGAFHLHEEAFTDVSEEHRFGLNRLVSPASLKVANTSRVTLAKDLKRLHPEIEFTALKHHIHGLDSGSVMQLPLLCQMPASALLRQVYRPATLPEELKNVNQDQREAWYRQIANMEKKSTSEDTGLLAPSHATANSQTGTRPLPPTPSMPTGASVPHSVHSRSRPQSRPSHVPATSVNTVPLGHHRSTASARNDGLNTRGGGLRTRLTGALQQIGIGSSSADPPANSRAGSAHRVRDGRVQKRPTFSLNSHGRG